MLDAARGVSSKFTTNPADDFSPRWSPDGQSIVFNSNRGGVFDLYVKSVDGTAPKKSC
jgi:TolB protein